MSYQEDILLHYGRKGQKWGVRRSAKELGQDPASNDAEKVNRSRRQARKNKSTNSLSNKELQDAITRMNLEKNYRSLAEKPSLTSKGAKLAGGILVAVGTQVAKEAVSQRVNAQAINKGILIPKGGKPSGPSPTKGFITPLPRTFAPPNPAARRG